MSLTDQQRFLRGDDLGVSHSVGRPRNRPRNRVDPSRCITGLWLEIAQAVEDGARQLHEIRMRVVSAESDVIADQIAVMERIGLLQDHGDGIRMTNKGRRQMPPT